MLKFWIVKIILNRKKNVTFASIKILIYKKKFISI